MYPPEWRNRRIGAGGNADVGRHEMGRVKPPIAPVLEHYGAHFVPNRRGWASMKCPFHDDRTASAAVNTNEDVQAFTCFACQAKGDAYGLVMWKEGCDFQTARRTVEEITGISYQPLSRTVKGVPRRYRLFEDEGPNGPQLSILQARGRRHLFGDSRP